MIPPLPPRFLNWRSIDGRKVPCDPAGNPVDAHDPQYHSDYATAAARGMPVAFDIRAEDGLFFLDLDKCLGADGQWNPEATAIFLSFAGAWGEVSSSGTGLHIIGRCDPSRLQDRRNKWDGWLECYTDQRFVAFGPSGWAPIGGVARPDTDWTDQLLSLVPQREHLGELPTGVDPSYTGPADDDELLAVMLRSTGGAGAAFGMRASVAQLWNANSAALARFYPDFAGKPGAYDASSADAALMSHLAFWTGKDMPRMDRLFRRSGLVRPKYLDREDYRRETIQNAARLCKQVYDRPAPSASPAPSAAAPGGTYLTTAEMIQYFQGCIYIREAHRVLVPDGSMLRPEQFDAHYGGHMFQMMPDGTKPTESAFKALTQNRAHQFPKAVRSCFRPDLPGGHLCDDGSVNTYIPPDVEMTDGDVTPFLTLLEKLLPSERDRGILLSWMAKALQNPGIKLQWAPVLQGCEGNGKTLVFSTLAYAIGHQYTHEPKAKQLGGQFNSYLQGKLFILVEEVHMRGRLDVLDDLKPLITNLKVEIEGKGQDKRMIENRANWGFCTNYKDAVLKSRNDRRYAIMFTAQQCFADLVRDGMTGSYFPDLYDWLRHGGGYAAVAGYLARYRVDEPFPHRAPETSSTDEAVEKSLGSVETEIHEATENNTAGFRGGWVSSWALDRLMRDRGIRIGRNKLSDILRDMGYHQIGRSAAIILAEEGKRPMLYAQDASAVVADYPDAQNYPRA